LKVEVQFIAPIWITSGLVLGMSAVALACISYLAIRIYFAKHFMSIVETGLYNGKD
jgi:hypothetical protein